MGLIIQTTFWDDGKFWVLIELQLTWESAFVKIDWIINLRSSYLTVSK